jgi:hypothetical protein
MAQSIREHGANPEPNAGEGDVGLKAVGVSPKSLGFCIWGNSGYFMAVLRTQSSSSDFMAEFEGTPARIEIKNLAEARDLLRPQRPVGNSALGSFLRNIALVF